MAYHLHADQRTHCIVDGNNIICRLRTDGSKAILNTMIALSAAESNLAIHAEVMLLAEPFPHLHIVGMKHNDYMDIRQRLYKTVNSTHHYRPATQQHKLLRHITAHTQSLAAGY